MNITKKKLLELVKKHNELVQIKNASRMKKEEIIEALKKVNYKVHYNEKKEEHELHPIQDPKRISKVNSKTKMPLKEVNENMAKKTTEAKKKKADRERRAKRRIDIKRSSKKTKKAPEPKYKSIGTQT
jgi:hypothetical protein|tara:strand:+ start:1455 stop:1838 length:384 start_codon:yes stop_codon:yes gene_type:complete